MKNKIICAITGKNIDDIGNGRSETYYKNIEIKEAIAKNVMKLIEGGVTDFICNAEYGFPLWACEIITSLQVIRIQQGYQAPRLHIVMPFEEQAAKWSDDIHERFCDVIECADEVKELQKSFSDKCYENCERFMVDKCDFLFTDDENDFAAQYANLHKKPVVICEVVEIFEGFDITDIFQDVIE